MKEKGIRKFEFATKTQFLYKKNQRIVVGLEIEAHTKHIITILIITKLIKLQNLSNYKTYQPPKHIILKTY